MTPRRRDDPLRRSGRSGHSSLHAAYTIMADLVRGNDRQVVEDLYWYFVHTIAANAFPEGVHYQKRDGREIRIEKLPTHFGEIGLTVRGAAPGVHVTFAQRRRPFSEKRPSGKVRVRS